MTATRLSTPMQFVSSYAGSISYGFVCSLDWKQREVVLGRNILQVYRMSCDEATMPMQAFAVQRCRRAWLLGNRSARLARTHAAPTMPFALAPEPPCAQSTSSVFIDGIPYRPPSTPLPLQPTFHSFLKITPWQ